MLTYSLAKHCDVVTIALLPITNTISRQLVGLVRGHCIASCCLLSIINAVPVCDSYRSISWYGAWSLIVVSQLEDMVADRWDALWSMYWIVTIPNQAMANARQLNTSFTRHLNQQYWYIYTDDDVNLLKRQSHQCLKCNAVQLQMAFPLFWSSLVPWQLLLFLW